MSFDALEYTRDALAKELYMIELHSKDGSAVEAACACIQEKHLLGVEGLAQEGILMAEDDRERAFYGEVADLARDLRKTIVDADFEMPHNPADRGKFHHVQVCAKEKFDPESFRVISFDKGIKATIGCPESHFVAGRCQVGTVVQHLMFPKERFTRPQGERWRKEHKMICPM